MAEEHFEVLDLSKVDVRVRGVLSKMNIQTVDQLLELNERDFSRLRNCGAKTVAKIVRLQEKYGKEAAFIKDRRQTVDKAVARSRGYVNRLIIVAMAANDVINGAEKESQYHFRVIAKRLNALRRALDAFRKQG